MLFKRQDSCHEITFLGFEIEDNGEVLESPQKSNRRIEVYGDSVSAGEVSEAVEYTGNRIRSITGSILTAGIPMRG